MARKYKCAICNQFDHDENMVIKKVGSVNRRIHKGVCHDKYIKDQEFKQKEREELDSLYESIKDICEVSTIPPSFMGLIQRLRNGNPVIGMRKSDTKQFKQGFSYPVIQRAYEEKSDLIKWKKSQWDGSSGRFLTFVLFYYIMDIIENAHSQTLREKRQDEVLENTQPAPIEELEFNNQTSKDDDIDISEFI